MNKLITILLLFLCGTSSQNGFAQKKSPNILWLVVEDLSPYFSFYGNPYTNTPTLDELAAESIVFTNAFSNGAQCSPARSTLISGIYAPMLATDWHREARAVPEQFYFPKYLQEAGYYCTNSSKRDYNASNPPQGIWNDSSNKASYVDRPDKEQPFFAVFNYGGTHTKRIATRNVEGRSPRRTDPARVELPPYLPDEAWIRDDLAWHYDAVTEMDAWVKSKLEELEASGEADNTIVFFYSDHGGCLPRAKAFVYETGTQIPLVVHFPKKLKRLAGVKTPSRDDRLVGFIDFAPTLFNLIGMEAPGFMMGQAFLGRKQPQPKSRLFLYRANQEQSFIPSRAWTDGRYRLIWNFNTAYPNGARQSYQWQMPSYQAWDRAHLEGKTDGIENRFWEPMTALEFYDTDQDPYEVNNLVNDPAQRERVSQMLKELMDFMIDNKDLGLYPWSMRHREDATPFYESVRLSGQDVASVIRAAALASIAGPADLPALEDLLNNTDPAIQYWAARGVLQMLEKGMITQIPGGILRIFGDEAANTELRLACAEVMVKHGNDRDALYYIVDQVEADYYIAYATLQNLGASAKPAASRLIQLLDKEGLKHFHIRSALINTGHLDYKGIYPAGGE
ncbi:sulfatase family protein [Flavilitoribacter nigricans]|uniref:Sulfatase N-terminal domain-containing protein n=1 Tax=Flavilitoribacter nigricans (strain ATCC 23147 / DSM 23189 / NBRC 102662 / NCIMB 1420 / SS-2) TaxID=1122177 RepID=A0A2D0NBD9_FLAN2|nr:sulfatase [Flavilitoribacter nigricans]PHN05698.1 hypothetical protein CRP01_14570 [Flavilitoribacter nigricans DSM 23189 = NBRC 102662]